MVYTQYKPIHPTGLKEYTYVYTFKDDKIHKYFFAFDIDKDIDDPMGTATIKCHYMSKFKEYWSPIWTSVGILGGFYNGNEHSDVGWLFIGRVKEINQVGDDLEIVLQDLGWKYNQICPQDFYKTKVLGQTAYNAYMNICKELGIPGIAIHQGVLDQLKFDDKGELKYAGDKEVEKIPDPKTYIKELSGTKKSVFPDTLTQEYIENMFIRQSLDPDTKKEVNKIITTITKTPEVKKTTTTKKKTTTPTSSNIWASSPWGYVVGQPKGVTRTEINNARKKTKIDSKAVTGSMMPSCGWCGHGRHGYSYKHYNKSWVNKCPRCGREGKLSDTPKNPSRSRIHEGEWTCDVKKGGCGADLCGACGHDKQGGAITEKYSLTPATGSKTPGANTESYTKGVKIEAGEKKFKDIIKTITEASDSVLITYINAILITFPKLMELSDYLERNYDQQAIKNIQFWQTEDESYKQSVNQYGFYNTVYVKYNGGTVSAAYEDLVLVYDESAVTYESKTASKKTAQMLADSYLAAHVRDFGMNVELNTLTSKSYFPGNFVKVPNPKTLNEEKYFIQGVSVSFDEDNPIMTSLTLGYGPSNPDDPEIPEVGLQANQTLSLEKTKTVAQVAAEWKHIKYSNCCQTAAATRSAKAGDCFGLSNLLYEELKKAGHSARVISYSSYSGGRKLSSSGTHRTVQYYDDDKKEWVHFPYTGYSTNFKVITRNATSHCVMRDNNNKKQCKSGTGYF